MSYVVPIATRQRLLLRLLDEPWTMRLYGNSHVPAETDSAADYVEAEFPGYRAAVITAGDWTLDGDTATSPRQVFEVSADLGEPTYVHGYYATNADGDVGWALRFSDGPYRLRNDGDNVRVVPSLALGRMEGP